MFKLFFANIAILLTCVLATSLIWMVPKAYYKAQLKDFVSQQREHIGEMDSTNDSLSPFERSREREERVRNWFENLEDQELERLVSYFSGKQKVVWYLSFVANVFSLTLFAYFFIKLNQSPWALHLTSKGTGSRLHRSSVL